MPITYFEDISGIEPHHLVGFFEGWPNRPAPEMHLRLLNGSGEVVLARDDETGKIVGFITATTDGVLSAYIPLLEVLPRYRRRGIGTELVRRMLGKLEGYYMMDLVCDDHMVQFYEQFGMRQATAMVFRRRERQAGLPPR